MYIIESFTSIIETTNNFKYIESDDEIRMHSLVHKKVIVIVTKCNIICFCISNLLFYCAVV